MGPYFVITVLSGNINSERLNNVSKGMLESLLQVSGRSCLAAPGVTEPIAGSGPCV